MPRLPIGWMVIPWLPLLFQIMESGVDDKYSRQSKH
jgi:hypothetical protein